MSMGMNPETKIEDKMKTTTATENIQAGLATERDIERSLARCRAEAITRVIIADEACQSVATWDGEVIHVNESGGCPVERILRDIDWSLPIIELAETILTAWLAGYDGDGSGVRVRISRADESAEASA